MSDTDKSFTKRCEAKLASFDADAIYGNNKSNFTYNNNQLKLVHE